MRFSVISQPRCERPRPLRRHEGAASGLRGALQPSTHPAGSNLRGLDDAVQGFDREVVKRRLLFLSFARMVSAAARVIKSIDQAQIGRTTRTFEKVRNLDEVESSVAPLK